MPATPRLSLCIPTYNRAQFVEGAVLSGLREAALQTVGSVEVLVCDNASTDETPEVLARIQMEYPELRVVRNPENLGFDLNYLKCVEEARGEYLWILGDDDLWMPGSLAKMLHELDAGADACLCLAEACDLELNPVVVLPWFLDSEPPRVWSLEGREDLIRYFNACARNAGMFAFISVSVFRRERFHRAWETINRKVAGYPHLVGMAAFLKEPTRLHYLAEPLIQNRMSDLHANSYANTDLYGRLMQDFQGWAQVAEAVFGDDPELRAAFSRILSRNHQDAILPKLRRSAPTEQDWRQAVPYLEMAGYSPVRVAAVDFGFKQMSGDRLSMSSLNPASLCLADLSLVARGARHVLVFALGGLDSLLEGTGLLAALRGQSRADRIRVLCTPECGGLLEGFEVLALDVGRYGRDEAYREAVARDLQEFAPELAVNLDSRRGIAADDLLLATLPAGAIGFELAAGCQDPALAKALDSPYTLLLPSVVTPDAMLEPLGLEEAGPALWPILQAREETHAVLERLGWDSARTLAVLVDNPSIPQDSDFLACLRAACEGGWTLVGIGGRGTYSHLEVLLAPLEGRAVNLAGALSLDAMAALLQRCGAYVGGSPLLRAMARACGCAPFRPILS